MKVSNNGRYLVDDNNKPFFYLADTAWKLFYEPSREEAEEYLMNRKEKGFTVIMPCVLGECKKDTNERFCNFYGNEPLKNMDPRQPNEVFFENVDYIIDKANQLGLYIALLPTWGEFVGPLLWGRGPEIFDVENARIYGEFIGKRYKNKNIIWVLGGDRNPKEEKHLEIWRAMVKGIKAGDKGQNLMTFHPTAVHSSSQWLHEESWLDFNMMQTGTRFDLDNYNLILKDYNKVPIKPTLDGEARYEHSHEFFYRKPPTGRHVNAHQVRKAAYNAVLSGAMGHTYGCRDVWSYYVPSEAASTRDVSLHWKKAMDLPGEFNMGHLKKLMLDYPFYKLVPDQEKALVAHGSEEGASYIPAAISVDKDFALAYIPENQPVYINMSVLKGEMISTLWYNPRKGVYTPGKCFSSTNSFVEFTPPVDDIEPDYVLVLKVK